MTRKLRGLHWALLDAQANVLAEGPVGEWANVERTGIADTLQLDLSDGSLLVKREVPPDGWGGYTMSGNRMTCGWPPRPEA